ncbi:MAG: endonuclease/exonuclease/phosphatase family protein [Planctomycetota bacterium]
MLTPESSVMRIDGQFEDWKRVEACASDPRGDARGAFDVTRVYAASEGSVLYLRFDTGSVINLQNGPEAEGTLLILIDLPDNQRLTIDTRGRRAYLGDDSTSRIPWESLKYIVGPTYAQDEFEIQIDLSQFDVKRGDTISIQFGGSDELGSAVDFMFSQPSGTPTRRSHDRKSGTDVRIVSFNTYFEGLSDPNREIAVGRLLNSVAGDIYCFQEEWKTEGHGRILDTLMPLEDARQWHTHKVHGCVIASKYPLKALPSKNTRYAAARVEIPEGNLFVLNMHLSAMGYIDSKEDRLRVKQAAEIVVTIDEIHAGQYDEGVSPKKEPAIVILGDFNLVGSRKPLDIITEKEAHGLKNWLTPNLVGESVITWRGGPRESFAPGKLDYVVYSGKTLMPKNGFILNSESLNQTQREQLQLEPADSRLSDHLLIITDFAFSNFGNN